MSKLAIAVLVLISACHTITPDPGCPHLGFGDDPEGVACSTADLCFFENSVSSCRSAFYRCDNHTLTIDHELDTSEGASCLDSPIDSCEIEGNDCSAEPTGGGCACGDDGRWHCVCRCYNDLSDCGSCPATYSQNLDGIQCGPVGHVCAFPGHECDCVDQTAMGRGIVFSCH